MVFWIPALAWMIWGSTPAQRLDRRCRDLLCSPRRERVSPPLNGRLLSAGLPIGGRRRREGLWILGIGVFWLGFLLLFKDNFFFHFNSMNSKRGWRLVALW